MIRSEKAQSLIFTYLGIMQDLGFQNFELCFVKSIWIWKLLREKEEGGVKEKGVGLTWAGSRRCACQWRFIEQLSELICWMELSPVNQVNVELPRLKEE